MRIIVSRCVPSVVDQRWPAMPDRPSRKRESQSSKWQSSACLLRSQRVPWILRPATWPGTRQAISRSCHKAQAGLRPLEFSFSFSKRGKERGRPRMVAPATTIDLRRCLIHVVPSRTLDIPTFVCYWPHYEGENLINEDAPVTIKFKAQRCTNTSNAFRALAIQKLQYIPNSSIGFSSRKHHVTA